MSNKCVCGLMRDPSEPFKAAWVHAFDCPARFTLTNEQLAGIVDRKRDVLGHDPYNYTGTRL